MATINKAHVYNKVVLFPKLFYKLVKPNIISFDSFYVDYSYQTILASI